MECLGQVKINFFLIPKGKAVHTMIFSPPNHSSQSSSCGCWSRQLGLGSGVGPAPSLLLTSTPSQGNQSLAFRSAKLPLEPSNTSEEAEPSSPQREASALQSPLWEGNPLQLLRGPQLSLLGKMNLFQPRKKSPAQPPEPLLMRQIFFNLAEAAAPSPEHPGEVKPSAN